MRRRRNLGQLEVLKSFGGRRERRRRQRRCSLRRLLRTSVVEKLNLGDGGLLGGRGLVAHPGEVAGVVRVLFVVLAAQLLVVVVVSNGPRLSCCRQI